MGQAHEILAAVLRCARIPGRGVAIRLAETILGPNRGSFTVPLRHGGLLIIDGEVDQPVFYTGGHDWHVMDFLVRSANPGDVVVDAGAGIGIYTVPLALKVGPRGGVYAFEALQANFDLLQRNIELNHLTNVTAVHAAVSDATGSLDVPYFSYRPAGLGNYSLASKSDRRVAIQSHALDDFFSERGITSIDLMKMDIEGSEVMALRGMRGFFSRRAVTITCCEINPSHLLKMGNAPSEVYDLLTESGLKIYRIGRFSGLRTIHREDLQSIVRSIDCVALRGDDSASSLSNKDEN